MMNVSLRQRIFWWSAGSALAILLVAFLIVNQVFRTTIMRYQEETLVAQARLLAELQEAEVNEALDRAVSLATLPTLRAAIATGDSLTIRQNLEISRGDSGFEWLMLTTPEGTLVTATAGSPIERIADEGTAAIIGEARFYETGDLWPEEGRLTQVHATGIFLGRNPIAVLLAGAPVGSGRVERLEAATGQRIAILSRGRLVAGGDALTVEARDDLVRRWNPEGPNDLRDVRSAAVPDGDPVREFHLAGHAFIGTTIPLPNAQGERVGRLVAFRSLEEAMQPARDVRLVLSLIALVGVLLAFVSSYFLSRRITGPVNRLLRETIRLGSGSLDEPVRPAADDEIGALAKGFEQMRLSLRAARDELLRTERLSAIGRAASAIVHDFRQPITVITGHVALLRMDSEEQAQREEELEIIETQLERLNTMMSEILDFARGAESTTPTNGSVPLLLQEVTGAMRPWLSEMKISLTVEPAHTGEWCLDFPRTRRVLENLVRNAAAAAGPGGSVVVRSDETDEGLRLVVEDSGPGIPQEIRERLFEPFATFGKAEGTGLGLAIVKAFTEKQGGSVSFETSSRGTRFRLDFPRDTMRRRIAAA